MKRKNNPKSDKALFQKETLEFKDNYKTTKDKKTARRKKTKIIIWSFVLTFVLLIAGVCIRYRNILRLVTWENITAYINSQRYSSGELKEKMEQNKLKMENLAKENPLINIRGELSEEEASALASGEITEDEAKKIVKGDTTLEEIRENKKLKEEKPKEEEEAPAQNQGKNTQKGDRISEIISELYVIQADFMSKLQAIGDAAYAEYKAIHYDRSQIMTIVDGYTKTVGDLEYECDKKVNALLKELKSEVEKANGDKALVAEVRDYYYTEKSLKKSYYLDLMSDPEGNNYK